MKATMTPSESRVARTEPSTGRFRRWLKDPWRKPRFLEAFTWAYLAWSLVPLVIAMMISFNSGRSRSSLQGLSFRWWWGDPTDSLWHDPDLHSAIFQTLRLSITTMLIAVPLGVLFAVGIDRWRGRLSTGANFAMLLAFVMPEIIIGIAMFFVLTYLLKFVLLGTMAQLIGLITFQISYPVIIVRARLISIGKEYEEAAMDLGASPTQAIRRVLLPLLYPAILVSFALVFADSIDDFVTVRYLSGPASSEPLAVKIYNSSRGSPTPAINAAVTLMLILTLTAITIGFLVYRRLTRGQRGTAIDFATQI
jgi:spermidine/putrescine transport system permease protein